MLKKLISLITLSCFIVSFIARDTVMAVVEPRQSIQQINYAINDSIIPASIGRITEVWTPAVSNRNLVVVNIQDLHCHPEVQNNIAQILQSLDEKYHLPNVYVEGGYGDIDTSWLCNIKGQKLKSEILEGLVNGGKLTGTEYYSINSNRPHLLKGIENREMHRQNIARLGKILEKKEYFEKQAKELEHDLSFMEAKYFNLSNRKFNKITERYKNGKIPPEKYYRTLIKYTEKINAEPDKFSNVFAIRMENYPNLTAYTELIPQGKRLHYKNISRQLQSCISVLKARLPYSAYSALLKQTDNFSRQEELCAALAQLDSQYRLNISENYPDLHAFLLYTEKSRRINPIAMITEEKRLVEEIRIGFSQDISEREISFLADFYMYFKDYLLNTLSADDYAYFTQRFGKFQELWNKYAYRDHVQELATNFPLLDEYYKVNCQRNDVFLRNIPQLKDSAATVVSTATSSHPAVSELLKNAQIVTIVTGGFHSEGLKQLLKERNISYIALTPNVTTDTVTSGSVYTKLIKEQAKYAVNALAPEFLTQTIVAFQIKAIIETGKDAKEKEKLIHDFGEAISGSGIGSLAKAYKTALESLEIVGEFIEDIQTGDALSLMIKACAFAINNNWLSGYGPIIEFAGDDALLTEAKEIFGISNEGILFELPEELQRLVFNAVQNCQALEQVANNNKVLQALIAVHLIRELMSQLVKTEKPRKQTSPAVLSSSRLLRNWLTGYGISARILMAAADAIDEIFIAPLVELSRFAAMLEHYVSLEDKEFETVIKSFYDEHGYDKETHAHDYDAFKDGLIRIMEHAGGKAGISRMIALYAGHARYNAQARKSGKPVMTLPERFQISPVTLTPAQAMQQLTEFEKAIELGKRKNEGYQDGSDVDLSNVPPETAIIRLGDIHSEIGSLEATLNYIDPDDPLHRSLYEKVRSRAAIIIFPEDIIFSRNRIDTENSINIMWSLMNLKIMSPRHVYFLKAENDVVGEVKGHGMIDQRPLYKNALWKKYSYRYLSKYQELFKNLPLKVVDRRAATDHGGPLDGKMSSEEMEKPVPVDVDIPPLLEITPSGWVRLSRSAIPVDPAANEQEQPALDQLSKFMNASELGSTDEGGYQNGAVVDFSGLSRDKEVYSVGDLHTEIGNLEKHLNWIDPGYQKTLFEKLVDGNAVLVLHGDIVHSETPKDRENTDISLAAMQVAMDLKIRFPKNVYILMGNHDHLDLRTPAIKDGINQTKQYHDALFIKYRNNLSKQHSLYLDAYKEMLKQLPIMTVGKGVVSFHGGFPKGKEVSLEDIKNIDPTDTKNQIVMDIYTTRLHHSRFHGIYQKVVERNEGQFYYLPSDVDAYREQLGNKMGYPIDLMIVGHSKGEEGDGWCWRHGNHVAIMSQYLRTGFARTINGETELIETTEVNEEDFPYMDRSSGKLGDNVPMTAEKSLPLNGKYSIEYVGPFKLIPGSRNSPEDALWVFSRKDLVETYPDFNLNAYEAAPFYVIMPASLKLRIPIVIPLNKGENPVFLGSAPRAGPRIFTTENTIAPEHVEIKVINAREIEIVGKGKSGTALETLRGGKVLFNGARSAAKYSGPIRFQLGRFGIDEDTRTLYLCAYKDLDKLVSIDPGARAIQDKLNPRAPFFIFDGKTRRFKEFKLPEDVKDQENFISLGSADISRGGFQFNGSIKSNHLHISATKGLEYKGEETWWIIFDALTFQTDKDQGTVIATRIPVDKNNEKGNRSAATLSSSRLSRKWLYERAITNEVLHAVANVLDEVFMAPLLELKQFSDLLAVYATGENYKKEVRKFYVSHQEDGKPGYDPDKDPETYYEFEKGMAHIMQFALQAGFFGTFCEKAALILGHSAYNASAHILNSGNRIIQRINPKWNFMPRLAVMTLPGWKGLQPMKSGWVSLARTAIPGEQEAWGQLLAFENAIEQGRKDKGGYQEGAVVNLGKIPENVEVFRLGDLHAKIDNLEKDLNWRDPEDPSYKSIYEKVLSGDAILVFLGDIIHNESNLTEMESSVQIMQIIMELKIRCPKHVYIQMGNHDNLNCDVSKILPVLSRTYEINQTKAYAKLLTGKYGSEYLNRYKKMLEGFPILAVGKGAASFHAGPPKRDMSLKEIMAVDPTETENDNDVRAMVWGRFNGKELSYSLEDVNRILRNLERDLGYPVNMLIVAHSPEKDGGWIWGKADNHVVIFNANERSGFARTVNVVTTFHETTNVSEEALQQELRMRALKIPEVRNNDQQKIVINLKDGEAKTIEYTGPIILKIGHYTLILCSYNDTGKAATFAPGIHKATPKLNPKIPYFIIERTLGNFKPLDDGGTVVVGRNFPFSERFYFDNDVSPRHIKITANGNAITFADESQNKEGSVIEASVHADRKAAMLPGNVGRYFMRLLSGWPKWLAVIEVVAREFRHPIINPSAFDKEHGPPNAGRTKAIKNMFWGFWIPVVTGIICSAGMFFGLGISPDMAAYLIGAGVSAGTFLSLALHIDYDMKAEIPTIVRIVDDLDKLPEKGEPGYAEIVITDMNNMDQLTAEEKNGLENIGMKIRGRNIYARTDDNGIFIIFMDLSEAGKIIESLNGYANPSSRLLGRLSKIFGKKLNGVFGVIDHTGKFTNDVMPVVPGAMAGISGRAIINEHNASVQAGKREVSVVCKNPDNVWETVKNQRIDEPVTFNFNDIKCKKAAFVQNFQFRGTKVYVKYDGTDPGEMLKGIEGKGFDGIICPKLSKVQLDEAGINASKIGNITAWVATENNSSRNESSRNVVFINNDFRGQINEIPDYSVVFIDSDILLSRTKEINNLLPRNCIIVVDGENFRETSRLGSRDITLMELFGANVFQFLHSEPVSDEDKKDYESEVAYNLETGNINGDIGDMTAENYAAIPGLDPVFVDAIKLHVYKMEDGMVSNKAFFDAVNERIKGRLALAKSGAAGAESGFASKEDEKFYCEHWRMGDRNNVNLSKYNGERALREIERMKRQQKPEEIAELLALLEVYAEKRTKLQIQGTDHTNDARNYKRLLEAA